MNLVIGHAEKAWLWPAPHSAGRGTHLTLWASFVLAAITALSKWPGDASIGAAVNAEGVERRAENESPGYLHAQSRVGNGQRTAGRFAVTLGVGVGVGIGVGI